MEGDVVLGLSLTALAWLALLFVVLQGRRIVARIAALRVGTADTATAERGR